jgi:hypothetical protein
MTPDNSGMPPLPEPYYPHAHDDACAEYSRDAMLAYGRQVAQMCAEICEDIGPKEGSMKLVSDGFALAIRARFGLEKP